jgi:putative endonuclease
MQENTLSTPEDQHQEPLNARFFYVYILLCNDGGFYTGCTSNLKERVNRHKKGWVDITKDRLPVQLLWCCAFPDRSTAFDFEQYLKSGSGRAFAKKHLVVRDGKKC